LAAERAAQAKKEAEAKAKTKKEAEERRRREEAATALASAPSVPAIPSGSNFSPEPAEQEFNAHLAKIEVRCLKHSSNNSGSRRMYSSPALKIPNGRKRASS